MIKSRKLTLALFVVVGWTWTAHADQEVTFTRDVAPIMFKRCAECHRPGQVGQFSLLTYEDAAKRAGHIKEITADRRMPPWHAEPGDFEFLGNHRLTTQEIEIFAKWADTGAREGNPSDLPPTPEFESGWKLGKPDVVIKLKEVELPSEGEDIYRYLVAPIPLTKIRWLRGIEVHPGNAAVVHHMNLSLDTSGQLDDWQDKVVSGGIMGFQGARLEPFTGLLSVWTPGTTPRFLPDGYGQEIKPSTNMMVNIHYFLTGKPEKDQSTIGLYFTDSPTKSLFQNFIKVSLLNGNTDLLKISAGEKRHKVELKKTIGYDASLYAVQAHGHFLLRKIDLKLTLPDGETRVLLDIDDWDFNWQERYLCVDPPDIPRGTQVELTAIYDNSAGNPQNPNVPPKDVDHGPESSDEMCGAGFVLIPKDIGNFSIPPEGLVIPSSFSKIRYRFDKNRDNRLTKDELQLMSRQQLDQFKVFYSQIDVDALEAQGTAKQPRERLKLPKGGVVIPDTMVEIRERLDKNKDGRFDQEELDAMPEVLREKATGIFLNLVESQGGAKANDEKVSRLPADGLEIPEVMERVRERFDTNQDGKFSEEEFATLPETLQKRILEMVKSKTSEKENLPPLKLPDEGVVLPDKWKQIRERGDTNKDGRLTQVEFDALPAKIREGVEISLRQMQADANPGTGGENTKSTNEDSVENKNSDATHRAIDSGPESREANQTFSLSVILAIVAGIVILVGAIVFVRR